MKLSEAKQVFLRDKRLEDSAPRSTLLTYDSILTQFIQSVGDKNVEELSRSDIKAYHQLLDSQGYKPKTIRSKLSAIRSMVKYLYIEDITELKPEKVKIPPGKHVDAEFLTQEEEIQLLSVCRGIRDRALLLTLVRTGIRVSEFAALELRDLHRKSLLIRNGKGGKPRLVFISTDAERAIKNYLAVRGDNPGPLFPNPDNKPLSRQYISRLVTTYAKRAGIKKRVSAHTTRHTFATGYLEKGGTIEDLQQMLGHDDIRSTMIYLHFTNERLHKSYDIVMT